MEKRESKRVFRKSETITNMRDLYHGQVKHLLPALIFLVIVALTVNTGFYVAELSFPEAVFAEDESDYGGVKKTKKEETATEDKAPKVHPSSSDLSQCADGTFIGVGNGYAGYIKAAVTIQNHAITAIEIVEVEADDPPYVEEAKRVINAILAAQSLNVDTVSGATYSSNGIIMAVDDAISQAAGQGSKTEIESKEKAEKLPKDKQTDKTYKDGSYYGTAKGYNGNITVKVVIKSEKMTSITITKHKEDKEYLDKASAVIGVMLKAQSTNVDAVSGATFSSNGIILAVRDALKKAEAGDESEAPADEPGDDTQPESPPLPDDGLAGKKYEDGTYSGTAVGYNGNITVEVEIESGEIKSIKITSHTDDAEYITLALGVVDAMLKSQSTNVDAVSGATYSSKGIIMAVRDALNKAVVNEEDMEDTTEPDPDEGYEAVYGQYIDGEYSGAARGYEGYIMVKVTVSGNNITEIIVTFKNEDEPYFTHALTVLNRIVRRQTTDGVDTVSGATYSSRGLLDAVNNALKDAKIAEPEQTEESGD
jgi:uncharacterized protein with FMN-binding domain